MKTAWTKNRNADSVRSFAYRKGKFMKSKVEFYKAFFEELEKKGFGVAQPSSPDYVVDIQFKGKTIAFYTKADMIEKNPFVEVPEKQMERLWSMARATASLCGICSDQPYEEEKAEKLKNGVMKLNEHNGVILACKKHPLFDYVLSTYNRMRRMTTDLFRGSIFTTGRKHLRALLHGAVLWMKENCLRKRSCSSSMQGL